MSIAASHPHPTRALAGLVVAAILMVGTVACSDGSGSKAAFCKEAAAVPALDSLLNGYADADPGELANRLDSAAGAYDRLQDAAPEEIRGSVRKVVTLVKEVLDAVRANPADPEAITDQLRIAMATHQDAPVASEDVASYVQEKCDLPLNAGDG